MEKYFNVALNEAYKAFKKNEVPVGAVIVKNNQVIAKAHNNRQRKRNILGHAEIICILKAEKKLKDWRLEGCDLYVTLEPCSICSNIIAEARINNVFYLEKQDFQQNNCIKTCTTQTNVCTNIKGEYNLLLKNFFLKLRNKNIK